MKVNVTIALEIDEEAWTLNYGTTGKAAIRAEVKQYATSVVIEQFGSVGVLKEEN